MPKLQSNDAHIYLLHLEQLKFNKTLEYSLSKDEKERAEKRLSPKLKEQFVKQKAVTRTLLSSYLNIPAKDIHFSYSTTKKPLLTSPFSFNISHSGEWLLIGITHNADIGVDIECHKKVDSLAISKRFFSPAEQLYLLGNEEENTKRFFEIWTAKEAYIKALSTGIFHFLPSFCTREKSWENSDKWLISHIESPPHTHACIAISDMKNIKLMDKTKITDIL